MHDEGDFIVRFQSKDDSCNLAYSGPHMFHGKPIVVKPWTANFNFHDDFYGSVRRYWLEIRTIPVWVRLPNLPLNCWSDNSLSRLGRAIGVPLCAD